MANYFDQFDNANQKEEGGNFFDQFDAPIKKGLGQRLSEDFEKRKSMVQEAKKATSLGNQSGLEYALQGFGKGGLGFVNDVIGEGVVSAGRGLSAITPDVIEQPIRKGASNVAGFVSNSPAGDLARQVGNAYSEFSQDNPRTARNVEALANIGLLGLSATPIKGQSLVGAVADTTGAVAKPIAKVGGQLAVRGADKALTKLATPKMLAPNSEQLVDMSSKLYQKARASGEVFDPQNVTNKFVSAIESAKPKMIGGKVQTSLAEEIESSLGKYKDLMDSPLAIDEIDIIDKDLSNLKDQAYSAGKNQLAGEYGKIQNALRGSIDEAPSGQTLAQARDLFKRKSQMEDVERIFRNAEGRPNEAAIIQTGYRNLANQARKKGSGYTKEQIAIMDKAAKGGMDIDALKLASSRLIPIVAGASGGPVGAGIAYMGNLAAASGATALQTAKANKLAKSITKGLSVQAEPTKLNLTAQKLQKAFEAKKAKGK